MVEARVLARVALLDRIPCAHPGDLVLLRGVGDFFFPPISVMRIWSGCAQATSCSDASRTRGGDYDGETVVVESNQDVVLEQK